MKYNYDKNKPDFARFPDQNLLWLMHYEKEAGDKNMSEMKDKLHTGEIYMTGDASIMSEKMVYQDKLCEYNLTKPSETEKRAAMLK